MNKPYSESCDQNKDPILSVISPVFSKLSSVLEIGSGTGQHAIYFAEKMPHLKWYTSDCQPYLEGINMWLDEAALPNTVAPVELDVTASPWPKLDVDAIFTANTVHIMSWNEVHHFMAGAGRLLGKQGSLLIYGPFNYAGTYSSDSNERFDQWLKSRDPESGIKHFEEIVSLAGENGMELVTDYAMPANNRILHFKVPVKR
jgi:cyclopropane fatty-acyl-phospholipid synthase-like methyltransferase